MVWKLTGKYKWYFSRLKSNKVGATDAIKSWTSKNSRNDIFKSKQRTKKILRNIFTGFEIRKSTIDVLKAKGEDER